jgi:basic membrane protein A and related proteins
LVRLTVALLGLAAVTGVGVHSAGPASGVASHRLRIGLVTTNYGNDVFAQAAVEGLRRAEKAFGVQGDVRTPTPREGAAASLTEFAAQRYDLVVGTTLDALSLRRVARRFPAVRFALLDNTRRFAGQPPNVTGLVFQRHEAGYLAGYLAGLVERRKRGPHVVSAVGGNPFPGVTSYIAGYRAGAERADPRVKVIYGYSHSFSAPEACAAVASKQIAQGSQVVFDVAGACGPGTLRTARAHRVWGLGVDFDQLARWPHVLTSAIVRFDYGLFAAIRALKEHRFRAGVDMAFGLRQGAVGLGRINPKVPRLLRTGVRRIARQVATGKIDVPATLVG